MFHNNNNLTADSVTLTPGERIGHLKLLDAASNQHIDAAGEPLFQYLRRILTPTSQEVLSEPDSRVNQLDLGATPPDNIDFSNPHCQSDYPRHKAALVKILQKYKHSFSRNKFDVGAFSEEYIDFSLISGARPPPC